MKLYVLLLISLIMYYIIPLQCLMKQIETTYHSKYDNAPCMVTSNKTVALNGRNEVPV